jgi:hypothetical protein
VDQVLSCCGVDGGLVGCSWGYHARQIEQVKVWCTKTFFQSHVRVTGIVQVEASPAKAVSTAAAPPAPAPAPSPSSSSSSAAGPKLSMVPVAPVAHATTTAPALVATAPAPATSAPPAAAEDDAFIVWMKRALAAEQQLTEVIKLYELEQAKLKEASEGCPLSRVSLCCLCMSSRGKDGSRAEIPSDSIDKANQQHGVVFCFSFRLLKFVY